MSGFVLDASTTMAWCFEDECDERADGILDRLRDSTAHVPAVWPLEVANVLLVAERKHRLSIADSTRFLRLLASLRIRVETTGTSVSWGAILQSARELGLSSYDGAYLELALRNGLSLATRDARLSEAAARTGVSVL